MIHELSNKIAAWSSRSHETTTEQQEVVAYGIELILENMIKILTYAGIAILTGTCKETFIIFLCFCSLRRFAGGRHLMTSFGCFLAGLVVWGMAIGMAYVPIPLLAAEAVMAGVALLCLRYAPVDTENNPILDPDYRRARKWKAVCCVGIAAVVMLFVGAQERMLILVSIGLEGLSLLPAVVRLGIKQL